MMRTCPEWTWGRKEEDQSNLIEKKQTLHSIINLINRLEEILLTKKEINHAQVDMDNQIGLTVFNHSPIKIRISYRTKADQEIKQHLVIKSK